MQAFLMLYGRAQSSVHTLLQHTKCITSLNCVFGLLMHNKNSDSKSHRQENATFRPVLQSRSKLVSFHAWLRWRKYYPLTGLSWACTMKKNYQNKDDDFHLLSPWTVLWQPSLQAHVLVLDLASPCKLETAHKMADRIRTNPNFNSTLGGFQRHVLFKAKPSFELDETLIDRIFSIWLVAGGKCLWEPCNQRANLVQLVMAVLASWNRCYCCWNEDTHSSSCTE